MKYKLRQNNWALQKVLYYFYTRSPKRKKKRRSQDIHIKRENSRITVSMMALLLGKTVRSTFPTRKILPRKTIRRRRKPRGWWGGKMRGWQGDMGNQTGTSQGIRSLEAFSRTIFRCAAGADPDFLFLFSLFSFRTYTGVLLLGSWFWSGRLIKFGGRMDGNRGGSSAWSGHIQFISKTI